LVLKILKFEKWLKYANEMTDDIIHSTKYYIKYINSAIFVNFQQKPCNALTALKISVTMATYSFPVALDGFQYFSGSKLGRH